MASRLQCSSYACISISIVNPAFTVFSLCQVLVWNNFTTSLWDFSPGLGFQSGEETFGQNLLGCFIYYSAKLILLIYWTRKILKNIIFFSSFEKENKIYSFTLPENVFSPNLYSHKADEGHKQENQGTIEPCLPLSGIFFLSQKQHGGRAGKEGWSISLRLTGERWTFENASCALMSIKTHNISTSRNQATFLGNINHKL